MESEHSIASIKMLTLSGALLVAIVLSICFYIYRGGDGSDFTVADFWAVAGALLSGGGLLLSAFAAHGVFVLSKQNHVKGRLRDFSTDLPDLVANITNSANKTFMSLRQKGLLGKIQPSMTSLASLDSGYFKEVTDEVKATLKAFEDAAAVAQNVKNNNEFEEFWAFHKALTAVVDTVSNYRKDKGMV